MDKEQDFIIIRDDGENVEELARATQLIVAHDLFRAIAEIHPGENIQLRQGDKIIIRAISDQAPD